eukprot:9662590-Lingulodinium_polyedra.AAC.1
MQGCGGHARPTTNVDTANAATAGIHTLARQSKNASSSPKIKHVAILGWRGAGAAGGLRH